jgi:hypothetical protein
MKWAGHVEHMGDMRNVHTVFAGKLEGKITFRGTGRRWQDNVRIGLGEIGWLRTGTTVGLL